MNSMRRAFLKLLGAGGAALSRPRLAAADRIRILPDAGGPTSPELQRILAGLVPGPAAVEGGLSVLWLQAKDPAGRPLLDILTLDEGRAAGALSVIERARASVPELIAENRGKAYVLLLAGEILIGGKQNRVLRSAARLEGSLRGNAGVGRLFEFAIDKSRGAALLFEGHAIHVAIL